MSHWQKYEAQRNRESEAVKDVDRGALFFERLEQAGPVGRTLASVSEEEGWTQGQARRAVARAREMFGEQITYAADSRTFYAILAPSSRPPVT